LVVVHSSTLRHGFDTPTLYVSLLLFCTCQGVGLIADNQQYCVFQLRPTSSCVGSMYSKMEKGRTQCRELPLCAGSREGCQWQALPSPVQCEETVTRTRNLPVTGGKTLPLVPGPPFLTTHSSTDTINK